MDKQILNITANEQILTVDEPIRISTNKVNYIEARFDLGQNWSGYDSVRAVWFNDFYCISTVLDSQGVCYVPSEVMKRNGFVKVNLVGSISEDDVLTDRLTSYPIVAVIVDCTAQINGAETSPITPSQFEQYVAIVRDLVNSVKDIDHIELNSDYTLTIYYSDGTSDTTTSIRGADGNGIASVTKTSTSGLVDTYTITFTDGNTTTFTVTNGAKGDTGNGIQSIAKTSTVGLVDTYTITYTNGTTSTFTVTNGEKGDKGDTGEVSLSELEDATIVQTLSDTEPYNYRRTNNGNGAGHREYDEIVGASVGWNQLVDSSSTSVTVPSGHKYYANIGGTKSIALSNGSAISVSGGTDNVVDLTLMNSAIADYVYTLEQSTAGSGVAWLKTHFPRLFDNGYQPYDAGSIKSVSGLTAHEMVGVNQWDEEWELGYYGLDGQKASSTTVIRSKNKIKIQPDTNYYFRVVGESSTALNRYISYYDADENYLSLDIYDDNGRKKYAYDTAFTTPSDAYYMAFSLGSAYGTTYNNDICINLSDTSINGQYFPYEKHTYPLDPSVTLRGKYVLDNGQLKAVGDVWKSSGEITRVRKEIVLDGTETWRLYGGARFYVDIADFTSPASNVVADLIVNGNFDIVAKTQVPSNADGKKYISGSDTAYNSFIVNVGETTAEGVKAYFAAHPLTVSYLLTTPTTESATPYDNPQWCDSHGTEEYVGSELPVGHNTDYPMTLVDTMPSSNGTFEPRVTIANGKRTITWVSV